MPVCRPGAPGSAWDNALRQAGGHFLQSSAWQEVQEALDSPTLHCEEEGEWMWAAHRGRTGGVRYLYIPFGPTLLRAKKSTSECLYQMRLMALANRCAFVRFEPWGAVDLFTLMDECREVKAVQPKYTWLLDLADDEEMLRRNISKGHRSSINSAGRKGLTFRRSDDPADIGILIGLLKAMSSEKFAPQTDHYYETLASVLMPKRLACLYIADHEEKPVAAAMAFDFNGVRHYAHAAAEPTARPLSPQAPLVWQMILDAKAAKMHTFDFWGVLPRPKEGHPWSGFTQFKQAFGGRLEERAGTWEMSVRKRRYRMYRLMKMFR